MGVTVEPKVKEAKATLLNYILQEKEEMAREKQKSQIRETDFNNLIKELADGLKAHTKPEVIATEFEFVDEFSPDIHAYNEPGNDTDYK